MKTLNRFVSAWFSSLLTVAAQAFPLYPDPTDLWYIPSEPGWGMTITQQGETMFVVLYAHDTNQQPTWFVASAVRDTGTMESVGGVRA